MHRTVVTKHIKKIFIDGEVAEKSNVQEMHIANSDRPVALYSLDIILAVGYRTNSQKAILFRKWSTHILRQYLKSGYALDRYKLDRSPEAVAGLREAIDFMESHENPGKLKGKMTLKITKNFVEK